MPKLKEVLISEPVYELFIKQGWNQQKLKAAVLLWVVFVERCRKQQDKFVGIGDHLTCRIGSKTTRKKLRKFLRDNNLIQVKQKKFDDGSVIDDMKPKERCKSYKVKFEEWINDKPHRLVQLHDVKVADVFIAITDEDEFCLQTRQTLDLLTISQPRYQELISTSSNTISPPRKQAIRMSVAQLTNNVGSVVRGRKVNRLYSPWANCPREARPLFQIDGQNMVEFDLKTSQPTLLAILAEDLELLNACFRDEVYEAIQNDFECTRQEAKDLFFEYLYGPNRTVKSRSKSAFKIQGVFKEKFPVTAKHVFAAKADNKYQQFNHQIQNIEAKIFLDGILAELIENSIPALTIHDSVCVPEQHQQITLEVVMRNLGQQITSGLFKVSRTILGSSEEQVEIYEGANSQFFYSSSFLSSSIPTSPPSHPPFQSPMGITFVNEL